MRCSVSFAASALALLAFQAPSSADAAAFDAPANLTLAFVGNSGVGLSSGVLLTKMAKEWNVDALVHAGGYAYVNEPRTWWRHIDNTLGQRFPVFFTAGNDDLSPNAAETSKWDHDPDFWARHAYEIGRRQSAAGAECSGEAGDKQVCYYKGVVIVNLGYQLLFDDASEHQPSDYANFIEASFDKYPQAYWRICNIHIPNRAYNLDESKRARASADATVMQACLSRGAVVANAHARDYSRTHLMDNYATRSVASNVRYALRPGTSLQWVSGLGGARPTAARAPRPEEAFFAKVLSYPDQSDFGALLCTFNPDGNRPDQAECRFHDIRNVVRDQFTLYSERLSA